MYLKFKLSTWVCALCLVTQLCLTFCDPADCSPPGSSAHGDSPKENTGVGCHALLQRIFPTQGSNPSLEHHRQILYHLSHQESTCMKDPQTLILSASSLNFSSRRYVHSNRSLTNQSKYQDYLYWVLKAVILNSRHTKELLEHSFFNVPVLALRIIILQAIAF